ncbi:MAG: cupin domain-containing protein [Acidimicrobiales bacterium]
MTSDVVLTVEEVARRVIEPDRFVADTSAFIDVRIPGSAGKASYSFIGPGVSQNSDQTVNLTEPHGFNIGAATLPNGVVNNPHMHYTSEVFICTRGRFEVRIGQHGEQTLEIGPGTVFSAPTWVFRGFTNIGEDDGWLFTVLGDDDTGGILWAPQVLTAAAETGLYLSPDFEVIDTTAGQSADNSIAPIDEDLLKELDSYSDSELAAHAVRQDQLTWSERSLLSSVIPGHEAAVAPVIGFGISEDRRHRAAITNYHGFSIEWLRLAPGASMGLHRLDQPQVVLPDEGQWEISYNQPGQQLSATPACGSVVSVPAGCWRNLTNVGDTDALALVVCNGDAPARLTWDQAIVDQAGRSGWGRDASGYLAPLTLLGRSSQTTDLAIQTTQEERKQK